MNTELLYALEADVIARYAPRDKLRHRITKSYDNDRVEFTNLRTSSSCVEGHRHRNTRKNRRMNRRHSVKR